ncbi:MAG: molybdopterin-dependent oxidoreductase [Polyangiaceae bacterium]
MKPSVATACILCECNCGLQVDLGGERDRHFVRLRGDKSHPSSRGYACEKAHQLDHYQNSRDLLTHPLRRKSDGTFERIDWPTAISEVAARLASVRDRFGGETIFYYGGGGQGNHLPGAYSGATRRVLGSRYRSNALAQEKTGEFWVCDRVMGTATRADFEHCDVAFFLGKNPWHSHSIPRARVTLKEIAKDPNRTLIVVDPRRTETAELADIHLQVKPGSDVWLLSALLRIIVDEGLFDRAFVEAHVVGADALFERLRAIDVRDACARAGMDVALVERTARVIGAAKAFSSFEDLGVQMNKNSTLVSYLHRALVVLTGSVGRPGTHYVPSPMVQMTGGASGRTSPVVKAPIVAGLVPCNQIADEILTDHPKRYRAMLVEAANPAHSLADSPRMREALRALDTLVVIDVAMSETARLADYVLPAATQFEKAEATFFNFDFPENYFHLRPRLLEPLGERLPEAEIHARLVEALGALTEADYAPLREAARVGLEAYAGVLMSTVLPDPRLTALAPILLYRTLDLPIELREGAVVLGLTFKVAMENPESLARAGFGGNPMEAALSLFKAILAKPSGVVFAVDEWQGVLARAKTKDKKMHLDLPDLLGELERLHASPMDAGDDAYPFVLSAGERRSFTANTIMRDPAWRKKDERGALRMSPEDAQALGVATGDSVRLSTKRGSLVAEVEVSPSMQRGHVSLPNGLGTDYPTAESGGRPTGAAPNELTAAEDRDPFVGTPWHKHVRARIDTLTRQSASESA